MISAYTCQRMTGRYCDEMLREAEMLSRVGLNYGVNVLNPVLEEGIPDVHEVLDNVHPGKLEQFWHRDKEMIRESDIVIDYMTMNKSDGSNKEVAYNRFCLWKPTVRVWDGKGGLISRLEDDIVVGSYVEALQLATERWGTYEKLKQWRIEMIVRCYPKWAAYQNDLMKRYGITADDLLMHDIGGII